MQLWNSFSFGLGRLSRLFDLFGHGTIPPATLADMLPCFPSKYACVPRLKFEERVAWVYLAILNIPQSKVTSSGAFFFEPPVFRVDEIEDELADDEHKPGDWMRMSLEYVLTEQRDWHCSFRLVSPHILTQLVPPSQRPPREGIVRELKKKFVQGNDFFWVWTPQPEDARQFFARAEVRRPQSIRMTCRLTSTAGSQKSLPRSSKPLYFRSSANRRILTSNIGSCFFVSNVRWLLRVLILLLRGSCSNL